MDVSKITLRRKKKNFIGLAFPYLNQLYCCCHGFSYQNTAAEYLCCISKQPSKCTPLKVLRDLFGKLKLEAPSVYWI